MTRGGLYAEHGELYYIPAHKVAPPIDICGAGDTFLSAFICARAAGAEGFEAVAFANLASSVSIKKLSTTGTASPEEILKRHEEISRQT